MAAASSPIWAALNVFIAICGFFGGGNRECLSIKAQLPYIFFRAVVIDLTILAENISRRWSFMVSGIAAVWGLGNVTTGLVGEDKGTRRSHSSLTLEKIGPSSPTSAAPPAPRSKNVPKAPTWDGDTHTSHSEGYASSCPLLEHSSSNPSSLPDGSSPADGFRRRRMSSTTSAPAIIPCMLCLSTSSSNQHRAPRVSSLAGECRRARHLFSGPKQARLMIYLMATWIFIGIA